ncbi:hypothetical protein [Rudanella paleaurantiibacter]|nr:hypothetical protein [Rudanella paleaurantiibacter]
MAKKRVQAATASGEWRNKMKAARNALPAGIGQQDVLVYISQFFPDLDRLTYATRWRNAWLGRVADPELTTAVEKAAEHYIQLKAKASKRLSRQKMKLMS